MSIELVAKAKKTKLGGDSTAKLLLICLADYANDQGMAWPSVATMTDEVEKKERTIQNSLRKLERLGLIRVGDQRCTSHLPKGQRPTVYEILPEKHGKGKRARSERVQPIAPVQPTAPVETTPDTGAADCTPTGAVHDTPTGAADCTRGVQHIAPEGCSTATKRGAAHCTQTVIEPPIEPSRESTRAQTTKPDTTDRTQALADWTPNDEHRALADRYGLDCDFEASKFRSKVLANDAIPANLDAAFDLWLQRGHEMGIGKPAGQQDAKPCRHTWKCEHVTAILRQFDLNPDTSYDLACGIAGRLRDGVPPDTVIEEIQTMRDDMWELA